MALSREQQVYALGALLAVLMLTGGMTLLFGAEVERLPLRRLPQAPPPEETVTRELRYLPNYYGSLLAEDAKKYGVEAPSLRELARPLRHLVEFEGRQRLLPRREGGLETDHLKISLVITKDWAQAPGGGFTTDHLVLKISNKTDGYLAYRIVTEPPDVRRCGNKNELAHNAVALIPREEVARTECTGDGSDALWVKKVEVIELPPLAYHYVSRARPTMLLLDERTSGGHQIARRQLCNPIVWAEIRAAAAAKEVDWRDLVDFYARHSCEEYSYFRGYRYRQRAEDPLPARPPGRAPRVVADGGAP